MDSNIDPCAYPLSSREKRNLYVVLLDRVTGSRHRGTLEATLAESPEILPSSQLPVFGSSLHWGQTDGERVWYAGHVRRGTGSETHWGWVMALLIVDETRLPEEAEARLSSELGLGLTTCLSLTVLVQYRQSSYFMGPTLVLDSLYS